MDVKIIRFLNGEEVIGKISEKKGKYTIEKGAVIVPVGEQQLGMVNFGSGLVVPKKEVSDLKLSGV